ncbi:hypothetical protein M1307_01980 [Patescibacteria group bacterium]|nr:hypothetical protein [Patescibacteria group bacterium]
MDLSQIRKQIAMTLSKKAKLEQELLNFRPPMIKGSLFERYVVCKKPGCRCSRGGKHGPFLYMNQIINGRLVQKYVGNNIRLAKKLKRYKDFQDKMRELRKFAVEIDRLWDSFQKGLLEREEDKR